MALDGSNRWVARCERRSDGRCGPGPPPGWTRGERVGAAWGCVDSQFKDGTRGLLPPVLLVTATVSVKEFFQVSDCHE